MVKNPPIALRNLDLSIGWTADVFFFFPNSNPPIALRNLDLSLDKHFFTRKSEN